MINHLVEEGSVARRTQNGDSFRPPFKKNSAVNMKKVKHVKTFLLNISKMESHYCREKTAKQYRDLVYTAFEEPKKDQCDIGFGLKNGNIAQDIYDFHIENKNIARRGKDNDK
ncbi:hypothetical protein PV326_005533 [Microctonus aethiopoides]|nr:hypothetical protein PV326_005533 [Microctonus aethiopoides]